MQPVASSFNIPWTIHESYWLCVVLYEESEVDRLVKEFKNTDLRGTALGENCFAVAAPKHWVDAWNRLSVVMAKNLIANPKIAILPRKAGAPSVEEIMLSIESTDKIDMIAENLWLGEALQNQKLECYYQPVVDRTGRAYGYEAFARLMLDDGALISGNKIIEAARKLNIEHMVDKYLHMLAIKTFAEAGLSGNLFINFMTGFIQLPQKYLEKLTEAAKHYNINPKRIVLDVSTSWLADDMKQFAAIVEYCRQIGCSVALDDLDSAESLNEIMGKASPDFIKLDRQFSKFHSDPSVYEEMKEIITFAHKKGTMVIAEAVETEEAFKLLQKMDVDLFQGYYFSTPLSITQLLAKKTA